MATAYCATRITGTRNSATTAQGYLLLQDQVVARSGVQHYSVEELGGSSDLGDGQRVAVDRPIEEVSSAKFLASLNGASLCINHPRSFLTSATNRMHDVGDVMNARIRQVKGGVVIICDLLVKDQFAIDSIHAGTREISIGYHYELTESNGRLIMKNLVCNHVSLVSRGRANTGRGTFPRAAIVDSAASLTTDGRIDSLLAAVDSIKEIMERNRDRSTIVDHLRKQGRAARANDAVKFNERSDTTLDQLASELRSESGEDQGDYGRKLGACLGRNVVDAVESYRQASARQPNSDRLRAEDAQEHAAASFEAAAKRFFMEAQR